MAAFGGAIVLAFIGATAPASSVADHAPPACITNQQQGVLCVSVTDTPDPVAYSSFDGNSAYISYHAVVNNASKSASLSHVNLADTLPEGTTLVSATASRGSCSTSGQTVSCAVGALKKGQSVTLDVSVTSPATAESDPPPITITNTLAASFDERLNDSATNPGRQDTVTHFEPTLVSKSAGQAFIPRGRSGKVGTDPAATQYANVAVPNATADLLATVKVLSPDGFCVDGTVRIQNKSYICRDGAFVDVSVVDAQTGARYTNAQSPLVFHLRWDPSLVSSRQTTKNFVVFYQAADTAPIQVIDARCNAQATNLPCLRNIQPESVDVVNDHNGHMR
jgi:uncharacterized repeat protein (TIGR01451 family)